MKAQKKHSRMAAVLRGLIACLTICQFAADPAFAAGQRARPGKSKQRKATAPARAQYHYAAARPTAPAPQDHVWALDETAAPTTQSRFRDVEPESRGWLTDDQTVLKPVPKGHMFIAGVGFMGSSARTSVSGQYFGYIVSSQQSATSFGPTVGMMYGFTDNFYISASGSYMPGRTESSFNFSGAESRSTSNDNGWREPNLAIGATALIASGTRLTGEISGSIPVGSARSETRGNETTSNGLTGGGSVSPNIYLVSRLGYVKLLGSLSYDFALGNRIESVSDGISSITTTTGGNRFSSVFGIEFPELLNFGVATIYANAEASTSTSTVNSAAAPTTSNRNYQASQTLAGAAYLGIPVDAAHMVIMPRVAYMSNLDRSASNGLSVDRSDAWVFGLLTNFHF